MRNFILFASLFALSACGPSVLRLEENSVKAAHITLLADESPLAILNKAFELSFMKINSSDVESSVKEAFVPAGKTFVRVRWSNTETKHQGLVESTYYNWQCFDINFNAQPATQY